MTGGLRRLRRRETAKDEASAQSKGLGGHSRASLLALPFSAYMLIFIAAPLILIVLYSSASTRPEI